MLNARSFGHNRYREPLPHIGLETHRRIPQESQKATRIARADLYQGLQPCHLRASSYVYISSYMIRTIPVGYTRRRDGAIARMSVDRTRSLLSGIGAVEGLLCAPSSAENMKTAAAAALTVSHVDAIAESSASAGSQILE